MKIVTGLLAIIFSSLSFASENYCDIVNGGVTAGYMCVEQKINSAQKQLDIACNDEISTILADDSWAETFKTSLKNRYELGPNFNGVDYVFTYSCGGGAVCGNIFDSGKQHLIDFPTEFLIDSSLMEFDVSYNNKSNQICFSGESAYDKKIFDNQCYKSELGVLVELESDK
ncbi:hypothetical protein [Aliivibrio fischeri]|uniref:hypothetical protein n=1 Tax=Aliivibrio fischeri TaxID=668 RepID=UPI00105D7609|nr:hypothetical protein [Aliivibrio fischeri]TDM54308.1 hypothetical protein VFFQA001_06970 [Aliivibrio fischeri]